MKAYFYSILSFIFFFPSLLEGQIKLDVQANKNNIEVGEVVEINFIVTGNKQFDLGNITFPSIHNTQLLGSREQANFSYTKGVSIFTKIVTFGLQAENEGRIIIPPVVVEINEKKYTTKKLIIHVKKAKEVKALNRDKRIFLDVQLSETSVYNQQPIIATFKLYSLSFDALRRRSELKSPTINDFQVKKISNYTQRNFNQEVVGNRVYVSEEIGQYQLIPQKSGELTIPSFGLTLEVLVNYNDTRLIDINSNEVTVDVHSLPENAPKSFTGAVGEFKINTYTDKKFLKTNETFQIEIELIGSGNLSSLVMPSLKLSEDLEVYEPIRRNKFQTTAKAEKGKVVDTYAVVPQYGGNYTIPAIEFSYFNPNTKTYETIQTDAIELEVEGKPKPKELTVPAQVNDSILQTNDVGDSMAMQQTDNKNDSFIDIQLPSIKKPFVKNLNSNIESNWIYWLIPGGLLLTAFLFFLFKPKKAQKKKENSKLLKVELAELKKTIKTKKTEASVQKAEQILDQFQQTLNEKNISMKTEVEKRFRKVKEQIQLYRYAGGEPSFSLDDLYTDLNFIITESLK